MARKSLFNEDIMEFHELGLHLPTRTIFLGSEQVTLEGETGVDSLSSERVIKNLFLLEGSNPEKEITIIINNNPGGDVYAALAIIDAIQNLKSPVKAIVYGSAFSAASLILQAVDERVMAKHARQMLHYGDSAMSGSSKTTQKWADEYKKLDSWVEKWYLARIKEKKPRYKLENVQEMLREDTILSAEESIELGLADKILGAN